MEKISKRAVTCGDGDDIDSELGGNGNGSFESKRGKVETMDGEVAMGGISSGDDRHAGINGECSDRIVGRCQE